MIRITTILLLLWCIACSAPLYKPVGLGVPRKISTTQVMKSIKKGVELAQCEVIRVKKTEVIAFIKEDEEEVTLAIKYNPSTRIIHFAYVDSKNMDYRNENGLESIHFSYNVLVENLEKQIALKVAEVLAR